MPLTCDSPVLLDQSYRVLKEYIVETTGLAYYVDKDEDLLQRLDRRMRLSKSPDFDTYYRLLRCPGDGETELDQLIEELTVGETCFFRHSEMFAGLSDLVLPDLIERNRDQRRLRIWSAGCSIGAEPYSLAIMLAERFGEQIRGWDISILGTDINRKFLARANEGAFRAWDLRGMPEPLIEQCFLKRGDERLVRDEYRSWVSFQVHNLVRHPFPALFSNLVAFDLIMCRNVLIYFDARIVNQLIPRFRECLVDKGWLLVGHAEPNVDMFRTFKTVNVPGAVLYQKQENPEVLNWVYDDLKSQPGNIATSKITEPSPPSSRRPASVAAHSNSQVPPRETCTPVTLVSLEQIKRLADRGDLQSAIDQCDRLLRDHPENALLHLHRAMISEQMGDHQRAEMSLRRTIYLDPANSFAFYFLGLFDQKRGRIAEAQGAFARVREILKGRKDCETVPGIDTMTVKDLIDLTSMQQEAAER